MSLTNRWVVVFLILPHLSIHYYQNPKIYPIILLWQFVIVPIGIFLIYRNITIFNILLIFYMIIVTLSANFNGTLNTGVSYTLAVFIGFCIYISEAMKNFKELINGLYYLFVTAIIINFISILIGGIGYETYFLGGKNALSLAVLPAVPIIFLYSNIMHKKLKALHILMILICAVSLYVSESGTAIVISFLIVLFILFPKKYFPSFTTYLCFYIFIFLAIVIFRLQDILFGSFITNVLHKDMTFTGRVDIWDLVLDLLKESWLIGYGRGNTLIAQYNGFVNETHNAVLEIMMFSGVLGIVFFLILLLLVNQNLKLSKNHIFSKILSFSVFAYMVIGLTESVFYKKEFWILLIISYGIVRFQSPVQSTKGEFKIMNKNYSLNLGNLNKELRLLLAILRLDNDDSTLLNGSELYKGVDWDQFLQIVKYHRIFPLIYLKLKKINDKWIPSFVIEKLGQEYKNNIFSMLYLTGEMESISNAFCENNINNLFLKGPVIGADIYGDISLRTSKDLDILIQQNELKKAKDILLNLGYIQEEDKTLLNELQWKGHHINFFHPQKNVYLEIHWRLQRPPSKEPSFKDLWERRRISTLTKYPVYFLGKQDMFLYLVSHGARHGWFRLRWLVDIDKAQRNINIDRNMIRKYQNSHLLGQALILTSELLNSSINKSMQVFMEKNKSKRLAKEAMTFIDNMESTEDIMASKNYKRYLFSLKPFLHKLFIIIQIFYPGYEDTLIIRLPKSFHFLYYPLRPMLVGWRKIKKFIY